MRLKYGHVVVCTGCTKDAAGRVVEVQATLLPDTKSGTPGADAVKVKGTIGWVGAHDAVAAEVRLYTPLFLDEQPDAGGKDFKASLNGESKQVVLAFVDAATAGVAPDERIPFVAGSRIAPTGCARSGAHENGNHRDVA